MRAEARYAIKAQFLSEIFSHQDRASVKVTVLRAIVLDINVGFCEILLATPFDSSWPNSVYRDPTL
jgi:hypothetical protein